MRRILPVLFLLIATPLLTGAGQPVPEARPTFSDQQRDDLAKISAYLNGMRAIEGEFSQIGPNGDLTEGKIYIDKPGKVRFEYDPPAPTLIVCDGSSIYVQNRKLNTVDRYPLAGTPLQLILKDDISLKQNRLVLGVHRDGDSILVEARSSTNRNKSNVTLVFASAPVELRQWTVIDDQGLSTTVALRDVHPVASLDGKLFRFAEIRKQ
ncbi:MAG TPA: outer membrane lipoprotein carrier protein LolA [Rhizomicrobium sp.]|jgi:outer membrane lipoprotein-sorting protein|nr:outer membrane lipoprotein carrier protein LolA [Rhizomicrobium sp.]